MGIVRHTIAALAPFAAGILLGLAALPGHGNAAPRSDFGASIHMGDIRCAVLAAPAPIIVTAFQPVPPVSHRACGQQAAETLVQRLAPAVTYGQVRARFLAGP